ncbi:MAG TPA: serine/threonine-protein kinase [Patescibacteria group bacterium]|nr:serine/threonine-protein kinase [Patescibacteria group bacterium]
MLQCPSCHSEVPDTSRFCLTCGAALGVSGAPTRMTASGAPGQRFSSSDALAQGRFVPGTMLAGRYRIIGLLGKGGMGEVYRADDLKLGQPVALKFLPEAFASDPERLARFHNEVRLARQVSHANVCRVYDIGETDGHHFISMEYVDGEDLSSLLRRIGRLPRDKSVEIARQLCAGLAAAHERGVLHRDLKPANIMIDGRGKVRITDFGLAGLAGGIHGSELRAGTPSYMSPEQLAGREVTVRSDIYCLGLVLYEMFTGRLAFKADTLAELVRAHNDRSAATPSSLVPGFDPVVERVILRCLEKDPAARPASAIAVAAALPGGDPLAAALAAGETPSPEMVAAAAVQGGLAPQVAWACLASIVAGMIILVLLSGRLALVNRYPLEKPPEVLADRARDLLRKLGHTAPVNDVRYGFNVDDGYLEYVAKHDSSMHRWERLPTGMPPVIYFWYRTSPRPMVSKENFSVVNMGEPPFLVPGMATVLLDTRGDLIGYETVPPEKDAPVSTPAPAPDWSILFEASGLDRAQFAPAQPEWRPDVFADTRAAWTGTLPGQPDSPLRIEAAGYHGKPVSFRGVTDWTQPDTAEPRPMGTGQWFGQMAVVFLSVSAFVGAIVLARRSLKMGRGDRAGAFKLTLYFIIMHIIVWALWISHVSELRMEWTIFSHDTGWTLFNAALLWLAYLGLEPYARRLWPDTVISWNRLLEGRLRDPLVGRDILVGSLLGVVAAIVFSLGRLLPGWIGLPPPIPWPIENTMDLVSLRYATAHMLDYHVHALLDTMQVLLLLLFLRGVLRKQWLAAVVCCLVLSLQFSLGSDYPWLWLVIGLGIVSCLIVALTRFGLIAATSAGLMLSALLGLALTPNLSAWYATSSLLGLALLLGLAVFGFHASLAGRPLFRPLAEEALAE